MCTGNVCRSPSVAGLLARYLDGAVDVDGETWAVTSAGTAAGHAVEVDRSTRRAASRLGVHLAEHRSRQLDRDILNRDGADLVIAVAREHLRAVVAVDSAAWSRTFTLKELVRRARAAGRVTSAGSFIEWRGMMTAGRRAAELLAPDAADDVEDPYGRGRGASTAMLAEVDGLVRELAVWGPWTPSPTRRVAEAARIATSAPPIAS